MPEIRRPGLIEISLYSVLQGLFRSTICRMLSVFVSSLEDIMDCSWLVPLVRRGMTVVCTLPYLFNNIPDKVTSVWLPYVLLPFASLTLSVRSQHGLPARSSARAKLWGLRMDNHHVEKLMFTRCAALEVVKLSLIPVVTGFALLGCIVPERGKPYTLKRIQAGPVQHQ